MDLTLLNQILIGVFVLALILGAAANWTSFCTMGAVSDWVNMGDTGRLGAWFFAVGIAMLGIILLEALGFGVFDTTRPPYRTTNFAWPRYLLGGAMFGVGMTLASGCGNKNLVRIGGGNVKSVFVFLVAGVFAYLMTKTDFYAVLFHSWIDPISIDLAAAGLAGQDLGSIVVAFAGGDPVQTRLVLGGVLAFTIILLAFRSPDFRGRSRNILGGGVVGLCVLGAWYLTGGPTGQAALDEAEWMEIQPEGLGVQSFTFINPMGETLNYLVQPKLTLLTFGVVAVAGVIIGSFVYAAATKSFRIEWFADAGDFVRHICGAVLMGIGGVLAMGCTIGQGITGASTLAVGSFLALGAIVLASASTMKVQYYRMLYEDASFFDALVTGLVDLHMLPSGMRKLEAL